MASSESPPQPSESTSSDNARRPVSAISRGLPPSYEQALQHRRIERSSYHTPPGYPRDGAYPGPPRIRPIRSGRIRRIVLPSTSVSQSVSPAVVVTEDTLSVASTSAEDHPCMAMALPPMHICMAVTCLVLNCIVPGTGSIFSGFGVFCCTKSAEWPVRKKFTGFALCFLTGLAQIILTPVLLIGWIWSVMWGFALLGVSLNNYHGYKDTDEESQCSTRCASPMDDGVQSMESSTSTLQDDNLDTVTVTSQDRTQITNTTTSPASTDNNNGTAQTNNHVVQVETNAEVHISNSTRTENNAPSVPTTSNSTRSTSNTSVDNAQARSGPIRRVSVGHVTDIPADPPSYEMAISGNLNNRLTDVE